MRPVRVLSAVCSLLVLLSLSSCRRESADDALEGIRAELASAGLRFSADIRADYGERVFDLSVRYVPEADGGTLTVTAPEIIAGAGVRYTGGAAVLTAGDVEIYTGEILPGGLSPVDAVPVMLDAWRDGLVTQAVREKLEGETCVAAVFRLDDRTRLRTWFSEDTSLPLRAEFIFDGHTVVTVEFHDTEAE